MKAAVFATLLISAGCHAQVISLGPELSQVVGEQYTLFSECNDFIQTCPPPAASCAAAICENCTGLGDKKLNACCATDSAPGTCLATALLRSSAAGPATTTLAAGATASITNSSPAMTSPLPTGSDACNSVSKTLNICESYTPGFLSSAFSLQAPCLCYDANFMFDPSIYDGPWSNCVNYISIASPALYTSLASDATVETTPCASIGDIVGSGISSGAITRTPMPSSSTGPTSLTSATAASTSSTLASSSAGATGSVEAWVSHTNSDVLSVTDMLQPGRNWTWLCHTWACCILVICHPLRLIKSPQCL